MAKEINPDILSLKESSTLKINQTARQMRKEGHEVFHFGFGQSPFPVHPTVVETLKENAHQKDYLPTQGLPELREEIANWYNRNKGYSLKKENIIIGPGSKELIFQALFVLQGPVIIPAPSWVSYGPQVNIRGKHITRVVTQRENDYKLTAKELAEVCTHLPENQKCIVINSPNNPTGAVYNDKEMQEIAEVCRKNNIIIISDEIYGLVDFKKENKKSFMDFYPEGTIITGGLSKSHSAGGYRLGYLIASDEMPNLIKYMVALISETYSSVTAPVQYAAIPVYKNIAEIDKYVDDCTSIHKLVGNYMAERFNQMNVTCNMPEGAFYLFPSFKNFKEKLNAKFNVTTSQQLADLLLKETKVAMLPGSDFYYPEEFLCMRVATVDYDGEKAYNALSAGAELNADFVKTYCPSVVKGLDSLKNYLDKL